VVGLCSSVVTPTGQVHPWHILSTLIECPQAKLAPAHLWYTVLYRTALWLHSICCHPFFFLCFSFSFQILPIKNVDVESILESFTADALRTLGFAYMDVEPSGLPPGVGQGDPWPEDVPLPDTGLTLLGFIGIQDPLRATVPAAVQLCKDAGIKVRIRRTKKKKKKKERINVRAHVPRAVGAVLFSLSLYANTSFSCLSEVLACSSSLSPSFLASLPWCPFPGAPSLVPLPWCPFWCPFPGAPSLVPLPWCPFPGAPSLVPLPWCPFPGAPSLVPLPWCPFPGAPSLVPFPWCPSLPGAPSLVPLPWCPLLVPLPWCPFPGAPSLVPLPWCPFPGAPSLVPLPWCVMGAGAHGDRGQSEHCQGHRARLRDPDGRWGGDRWARVSAKCPPMRCAR